MQPDRQTATRFVDRWYEALDVMKVSTAISFVVLLSYPGISVGDSPAMPRPVVFVSPAGGHYFKLVPSLDFDESEAEGYLYRVEVGEDTLLYRTKGWFSFKVLVSNDGGKLARIGPWPPIGISPDQMPALVFYSRGVVSKTYFVSDLIEDYSSLEHSVSHYSWGGELDWVDGGWDGRVSVRTVEGVKIVFDIESGEIEQ